MIVARPWWVRALAVLLASLAALWLPAYASAADEVAFTISDDRITESSGLATDTAADLYWTINDSGSSGIAYGLNEDGETEGTVRFLADPVDIEAIAVDDNRLLLADIGDNRARRDFITVYAIDDPEPNDDTRTYRAYDFAYPDGAHDAEAMLVNGRGRIFFVTKEARAGIYRAPANPTRQGVNRLTRVGEAPAFVTDGTFSPTATRSHSGPTSRSRCLMPIRTRSSPRRRSPCSRRASPSPWTSTERASSSAARASGRRCTG